MEKTIRFTGPHQESDLKFTIDPSHSQNIFFTSSLLAVKPVADTHHKG